VRASGHSDSSRHRLVPMTKITSGARWCLWEPAVSRFSSNQGKLANRVFCLNFSDFDPSAKLISLPWIQGHLHQESILPALRKRDADQNCRCPSGRWWPKYFRHQLDSVGGRHTTTCTTGRHTPVPCGGRAAAGYGTGL